MFNGLVDDMYYIRLHLSEGYKDAQKFYNKYPYYISPEEVKKYREFNLNYEVFIDSFPYISKEAYLDYMFQYLQEDNLGHFYIPTYNGQSGCENCWL